MSVLRAFWVHPTKAEAAVWGTFPWEEEIWPPYAPLFYGAAVAYLLALGWIHLLVPKIVAEDEGAG